MNDNYDPTIKLTKGNCYEELQKAWNSNKFWSTVSKIVSDAEYSKALSKIRNKE